MESLEAIYRSMVIQLYHLSYTLESDEQFFPISNGFSEMCTDSRKILSLVKGGMMAVRMSCGPTDLFGLMAFSLRWTKSSYRGDV